MFEFTPDEYESTNLFINTINKDELIKFMIGQQRAIDGLTQNNDGLKKAFHEIYKNCTYPPEEDKKPDEILK